MSPVPIAAFLALAACQAAPEAPLQARADLYACDGCEAVFARDAAALSSDVVIAGPDEPGERMIVEGRVLMPDGKTTAPGVILYLHQTDDDGIYRPDDSEWGRRHGALHGWAVSDAEGHYRFRTVKPAPYPSMTMPAHIHLMVGEPGRRPYYIDDIVFAGEFGVDADYRAAQEFRGGGGITELSRDEEGRWLARRDIVLERHP